MIRLLELTGARRYEVAFLTVKSVREAACMKEPMLRLTTVKRGIEHERVIPISRVNIEFLNDFIDKNRRQIIKKTCGIANDDGFFLISETTGKRLRPNTITQEIYTLCIQAGIKEQTCPQMFRHRFITDWFISLIEQHRIENEDEFRKKIMDTETFKKQLQEWTGHKDISSLDTYLHLALAETANYKKTYNIVSVARLMDSLSASIRQIKTELSAGMTTIEAIMQLQKFMDAAVMDIEHLSEAAQ
jgi:site-specific recombinase XerD